MWGRIIGAVDRLFAIDRRGPDDIALLEERLATLQPRMPWLYAMLISCILGLFVSFGMERDPPVLGVIVMLGLTYRGFKWMRLRRVPIHGENARTMLRTIGVSSIIGSIAVGALLIQILPSVPRPQWQLMMVMASTCTVALAVPMGPLPRLARTSHLLFGVPAALFGIAAGPERAASRPSAAAPNAPSGPRWPNGARPRRRQRATS